MTASRTSGRATVITGWPAVNNLAHLEINRGHDAVELGAELRIAALLNRFIEDAARLRYACFRRFPCLLHRLQLLRRNMLLFEKGAGGAFPWPTHW